MFMVDLRRRLQDERCGDNTNICTHFDMMNDTQSVTESHIFLCHMSSNFFAVSRNYANCCIIPCFLEPCKVQVDTCGDP